METLKELIDLARITASAANRQPLKYMLSNESGKNMMIFDQLAWAGYLKDWAGPSEGEKPSAYIIMLGDTEISRDFSFDSGIAGQIILLGAVEKDLGGCMIASIRREKLRTVLNIPIRYEIILVIAIGKPKEIVVLEPMGSDGDVKYWRDSEGKHHVPKRSLEEVLIP